MIKKGAYRSILLILILTFALTLYGCGEAGREGEYTFKTYTSSLGTNWNPHTWQTSADSDIMDYLITPLVSAIPLETEEGRYQWCYEHARSVIDVTAECREDLARYKVEAPEGGVDEIDSGYVFEVRLREGLRFEDGTPINADSYIESMRCLLDPEMKNSRANLYVSGEAALAGAKECFDGVGDFSGVGIYKVDDLTFRYITDAYIEYNYLMSSFTSTWLVEVGKYRESLRTEGKLKSTAYNTDLVSTVSYGPYKLLSYQTEKEIVLVRNENWYGWERDRAGRLYSLTNERIDGERRPQYMATRVVLSVLDTVTAKQAFRKGELTVYEPTADEYPIYKSSEKLYLMDETYTMSFFFNTDYDMLRAMDRARGNTNSVVLINEDFRHAMSLALDRAELAYATAGYKPVYALLSDLYYYDIYKNPESVYRRSEAAMRGVIDLYDTDYGIGTPYPTLEAAYKSINGYNLDEARKLFKRAFETLTESGVYVAGEPIRIRVAFSAGALSSDDQRLISLVNNHLARAMEGTGFGELTLQPIGQVASRYQAVPSGEFAIGYGAWGGAAFYPFRSLRVYFDAEYENIHEGACWSPDEEPLTLTIDGEEVTLTYQEWSRSMTGAGRYSKSDNGTKLYITASLESAFLEKYYRIPLFSTSQLSLLSPRVDYYTKNYNVMYEFGGLRFMKFYYDDREWEEYMRAAGGRLNY